MRNAIAIVQARMGSTRLPGKTLADLAGQTVLERVIGRVRQTEIGQLVVATTWEPEDDAIVAECARLHVACFRGDTQDVLARYYRCWQEYGGDPIARVTADCPLLDPGLLTQVTRMVRGGLDYVGVKGAPAGYHQEAFSAKALQLAFRLATSREDREHVVPFMLARPAMFRQGWLRTSMKGDPVTLDTPDDLDRLRRLVEGGDSEQAVAGREARAGRAGSLG